MSRLQPLPRISIDLPAATKTVSVKTVPIKAAPTFQPLSSARDGFTARAIGRGFGSRTPYQRHGVAGRARSLAKSRNRYRLACLAFALSFLAIAVRLVTLGFAAVEPGYGGIHDISTTVHRPDILDRNGRLLATDIKGATLYADPAKVIDRDELVEQVAKRAPRRQHARATREAEERKEVRRHQARAHAEAAGRDLRARPGRPRLHRGISPRLSDGATASHVVGHVNVDNKGLAGIEKFIDDNPQLAMSAPENAVGGEAVTLSLDLGVQHVPARSWSTP